jgi:uncharacterized protein
MAPGETELRRLVATMRPVLLAERYVFAVLPDGSPVPSDARMMFREGEGTTLILPEAAAAHAGLDAVFPCRMITLTVQSSLEAVGFLAAVTAALAARAIGVNPVAALHHDHLFVPADRAEEALTALLLLQAEAEAA